MGRISSKWLNQLADPADAGSIPKCVLNALSQDLPKYIPNLYGDGKSAIHMTEVIVEQ